MSCQRLSIFKRICLKTGRIDLADIFVITTLLLFYSTNSQVTESAIAYDNTAGFISSTLVAVESATKEEDRQTVISVEEPVSGEEYYTIGKSKEAAGDFEEAISNFSRAIELDPDNAENYRARGLIHLRYTRRYQEATADFGASTRIEPSNALNYSLRGLSRFSDRDYEGVIEDTSKAIELGTSSISTAYLLRGKAQQALGNYISAIEDLSQAFETNSDDDVDVEIDVLLHRGESYSAIGQTQKAIADWKIAAHAGSIGDLENLAKQITVRIDQVSAQSTTRQSGSGIIIAQQGQTYYVLTAEHVVHDTNTNYSLVAPDGEVYEVNRTSIVRQSDADLAILKFSSPVQYEVATFVDYSNQAGPLLVNSFASGWPESQDEIQFTPGLLFRENAVLEAFIDPAFLTKGYEIAYTNLTYQGMSGGSVLDAEGRVIGIHGIAVGERIFYYELDDYNSEFQWGFSGGIPTETFLRLAPQLGINLDWLKVERSFPLDLNRSQIHSVEALIHLKINTLFESPERPSDWLRLGNQLWRAGLYDEAGAAFDEVLKLKPDSSEALFGKGLVSMFQGNNQKALEEFTKATTRQDNFRQASFMRGRMLIELARYEEALTSFDQAIQVTTNLKNFNELLWKSYIMWYRGQTFSNYLNMPHEALDAFTKAINLYELAANTTSVEIQNQRYASLFYTSRANVQRELGNLDNAVEDYERAIDLNPTSNTVYKTLAQIYQERGNQVRATELIAQDLLNTSYHFYNSFSENSSVRQTALAGREFGFGYQGLAQLASNDYEEAILSFTEAIKVHTSTAHRFNSTEIGIWTWYWGKGFAHYNLGNYSEAILHLSEAIKLYPEEYNSSYVSETYFFRGDSFAALNEFSNAISDFAQAIELDAKNFVALNTRGTIYITLNEYSKAIRDFTRAIELNPQYAYAFRNRGVAYANLKDYQNSIKDFTRAITLNPEYANAYANRGAAYRNINELDAAVDDLTKSIELDPQSYQAFYNRGLVYAALERYQDSVKDFSQVIELNPQLAEAYRLRGITYANLANYEQAIQDYTDAISLNPPNPSLYYYERAELYRLLGQDSEAVSDLTTVVEETQISSLAHLYRGLAYRELQRYRSAISEFELAKDLAIQQEDNSTYQLILFESGLLHYEVGDTSAAIDNWKLANEFDSDDNAKIQLVLATASYFDGDERNAIELGRTALMSDERLSTLEFLQSVLWGERLLNDTRSLLKREEIQQVIEELRQVSYEDDT